jgi:hypothetical protein
VQELRSEPRILFIVSLRYINGEQLTDYKDFALSNDLSRNGLGFHTDKALEVGQGIKLYGISEKPVSAQVRWCKKVSGTLFRAGLLFV